MMLLIASLALVVFGVAGLAWTIASLHNTGGDTRDGGGRPGCS